MDGRKVLARKRLRELATRESIVLWQYSNTIFWLQCVPPDRPSAIEAIVTVHLETNLSSDNDGPPER